MQDSTATPETGPVDAPASNDSAMDHALKELYADAANADKADEAEPETEVKDTEDEGEAKAPDAEESATDPIEPDEESEEATPDEDEAEPTAEEPRYKVKVNGEEVEVPLSELQKGYSRTEDYKAKTMALADERRQVEAQKATIERDVKVQYANELKQQIDAFEALDPVLTQARSLDWEALKAQDPATYVEWSDAVNQRIALIGEHREKIAQIESERAEAQQVEHQQRMEVAANTIVEVMPELAEGSAFQEFATSTVKYLADIGIPPDDITEIATSPQALIAAHKAMRWDALQAAKTNLPAKKIVPKSKVKSMTTDASDSSRSSRPKLKPGASREEAVAFALNELRKG